MRMRRIWYLLLLIMCLLNFTGCKRKSLDTNNVSDEAVVESTEDPFAISAEINVQKDIPREPATLAEEVEVLETYEDGSYSAVLADGSTIITSSAKGLIDSDKLTEIESVALDSIVGTWKQDNTLSKDFLKKKITKESFPSLSDGDCSVLIDRIQKDTPHNEEETVPYTEPTTERVEETQPDGILTQEEFSRLSEEEQDAYIEKMSGGGITVVHPDTIDMEVAGKLQLQGAQ